MGHTSYREAARQECNVCRSMSHGPFHFVVRLFVFRTRGASVGLTNFQETARQKHT